MKGIAIESKTKGDHSYISYLFQFYIKFTLLTQRKYIFHSIIIYTCLYLRFSLHQKVISIAHKKNYNRMK